MSLRVQVGSRLLSGKCLYSSLAEAIVQERRGGDVVLPVICSENAAAISGALLELGMSCYVRSDVSEWLKMMKKRCM